MRWIKLTIYNDLTLPVGRYGRVVEKLQSDAYADQWLEVGDIVQQVKAYGPWPDNYQIFNVTKGITGYTNPSHWRQTELARKPLIPIRILE